MTENIKQIEGVPLNTLKKKLEENKVFDYKKEYARDRVDHVIESWDEELYVDCISSDRFINEQIKTKNSQLSDEGNSYTSHLDRIANYILFSAYDDAEDRMKAEILKEEYKEIKKKKDANKREKLRLSNLDKQRTRPSLLANSRHSSAKNVYTLHLDDTKSNPFELELDNDSSYEGARYTHKDKELNQNGIFKNTKRYWTHYGQHNQKGKSFPSQFSRVDYSVPYAVVAYESIKSMQDVLDVLENRLSVLNPFEEKAVKINKLKRELKEEYNHVVNIFRSPMEFKASAPTKPVDELMIIEKEIDYTNKDFIKELVYNYATLKSKYGMRPDLMYWDMLKDIDSAHRKLKVSANQKIIMNYIMNSAGWNYEELINELTKEKGVVVGKSTITYHINNYINSLHKEFCNKQS